MKRSLAIILIGVSSSVLGQKVVVIKGHLFDEQHHPVAYAPIVEKRTQNVYLSDEKGEFTIKTQIQNTLELEIQFLGFHSLIIQFTKDKPGQYQVDIPMTRVIRSLKPVSIEGKFPKSALFYYLNPVISSILPNVAGGFETYLKTLPGVSSNNELSSQYTVRGGNYDENLVYLNDVEIFKPFLVQQGQQEGLSILNPEMVSKIKFSTGGFGAEYGDKVSSVLDISYKTPSSHNISASLSLLGASINLETVNANANFGLLLGFRERSNQFLLSTLDIHGNYRPLFTDFQSLLWYQINPKLTLSSILYGSHNRYEIIPTERKTTFGTLTQAFQFDIGFSGEEKDFSNTGLFSLKLDEVMNKNTSLKWVASVYKSDETNHKSIQGDYYLNNLVLNTVELPANTSTSLGIGEYGEYANNFLRFSNFSLEHKGNTNLTNHFIRWGFKYDQEHLIYRVHQYNYLDTLSVQEAMLGNFNNKLEVSDSFDHDTRLDIHRLSAFGLDEISLGLRWHLTAGIRFTYLNFNHEFLKSPRIIVSYKPPFGEDHLFRFAYGIYYQSPIFNEFFNYDGSLSPKRASQKTTQYVLSWDWGFKGMGTDMHLTTGAYYKNLKNLIPYQINDVKIDYLGNQVSNGYAYGLDLRLSGQIVKDLESSLSVSIQKTEEKIENYFYPPGYSGTGIGLNPVGFLPRPSDQRFNLALFFQDKFVGDPSSKVHLTLIYGSNLPTGPPDYEPYKDVLRTPAYKRVDIGFSKEFNHKGFENSNRLYKFQTLIAYIEIFNLFNQENTISYFWIKDIQGGQFAVPNYLTQRILNFRLVARF